MGEGGGGRDSEGGGGEWYHNFCLLAASSALNFFPMLEYVPGDLFKMKAALKNVSTIHQFLWEEVRAHMATYSEEDCGDFIHAYIRQMKHRQEQGTPTTVTGLNVRIRLTCLSECLTFCPCILHAVEYCKLDTYFFELFRCVRLNSQHAPMH